MAPGAEPVVNVAPFEVGAATGWDELVAGAPMGTFLHSRAFLSYHGDRFQDASTLLYDDRGVFVGVVPAAVDPSDAGTVVSHPGATFGGIVHDGPLAGAAMIAALTALAEYYRSCGFSCFRYAPVPWIYHLWPSADDLYALFRLGAKRTRCDLSCAVDLEVGPRLSSRRRRGLAKSRRSGLEVVEGPELVEEFWPVIEANLAARHGVRPTHTAAEMRLLLDLFPNEIQVVLARYEGAAVAGVVIFDSPRVSHAQYIASNDMGNKLGGLDAIFDRCLERAGGLGARFFDFGISNVDGVLNEGLYDFKAQFGGGGVAYERYEFDLSTPTPTSMSA